MATVQLNLPDELKAFAESKANSHEVSLDQYIADLIAADDELPISPELEAKLLEGLRSGPAAELTPAYIESVKARARGGRK